MRTKPAWFYQQSGVIPYRVADGSFAVLLVTSLGKGRWIIPKGIVEPGYTPAASAQKEAQEEAGIVGSVSAAPVGSYQYEKWGGECTVQVFALEVHTVWDTWPEAAARKRQWMALDEAANSVRELDLQQLISSLPELLKIRTLQVGLLSQRHIKRQGKDTVLINIACRRWKGKVETRAVTLHSSSSTQADHVDFCRVERGVFSVLLGVPSVYSSACISRVSAASPSTICCRCAPMNGPSSTRV